jgi:hypothetical protein
LGINGIAYNGAVWVAVGSSTQGTIAISKDGINWTITGVSGQFTSVGLSVLWDGKKWLASGDGGASLLTSTDGLTWSSSGISGNITSINQIAYDGVYYIACGSDSSTDYNFSVSTDGLTWTNSGTIDLFTVSCRGISTNGNGTWIGIGGTSAGNVIVRSTDNGGTWSSTTGDSFFSGNKVIWNGTRWIAVGGVSTPRILISADDGLTWTASGVTQPFSYNGSGLATTNIWKVYPTTQAAVTTSFSKLIEDLYAYRGSISF